MTAESKGIRRQLEGIVALLLALALIAERASHAPLSVRLHVLSILAPAALAAQDYVFGETGRPALLPAQADALVDDAEKLAARLRVLAFVLAGVAFRLFAGRRRRPGVSAPRGAGHAVGQVGAGSLSAWPFDTS